MTAALVLAVPAASADPIGYTLTPTELARVDLATAVVTPIGPTGFPALRHLAFHADGTLYGLAGEAVGSLQLVRLDPATGAGERAADLDLGVPSFEVAGFTGVGDGTLWASGRYPDGGGGFHKVYLSIDPGGSVGELMELPGGHSLLFQLAACGDQLMVNRDGSLETLDPVTGDTVELFHWAPFGAMDVGPDGGVWGLYFAEIVDPPPPFLGTERVDLVTGAFDPIAAAPNFGVGLAIAPPVPGTCFAFVPPAVPALSPLALAVLAVSLAAAARWVRRRHA